jgi:hypothetical protein
MGDNHDSIPNTGPVTVEIIPPTPLSTTVSPVNVVAQDLTKLSPRINQPHGGQHFLPGALIPTRTPNELSISEYSIHSSGFFSSGGSSGADTQTPYTTPSTTPLALSLVLDDKLSKQHPLENAVVGTGELNYALLLELREELIHDYGTPPPTPVDGPEYAEDGGHSEDLHNLMFDEASRCVLPDDLISKLEWFERAEHQLPRPWGEYNEFAFVSPSAALAPTFLSHGSPSHDPAEMIEVDLESKHLGLASPPLPSGLLSPTSVDSPGAESDSEDARFPGDAISTRAS